MIIIGLLCAVCTFAVSYATPYKGSGYSSYAVGYMRTSAPVMGIAQAPVATMSSTSASLSVGVTRSQDQGIGTNRGIYTSASAVRGGVTTSDSAAGRKGAPGIKKTPSLPPGACEDCTWVYDEERGVWYCLYCDCEPEDGHCEHHCVPLEFDESVWLLMAAMVMAYVAGKQYASHRTETSAMRTTCERD